jgi:hypothetical protein
MTYFGELTLTGNGGVGSLVVSVEVMTGGRPCVDWPVIWVNEGVYMTASLESHMPVCHNECLRLW